LVGLFSGGRLEGWKVKEMKLLILYKLGKAIQIDPFSEVLEFSFNQLYDMSSG